MFILPALQRAAALQRANALLVRVAVGRGAAAAGDGRGAAPLFWRLCNRATPPL